MQRSRPDLGVDATKYAGIAKSSAVADAMKMASSESPLIKAMRSTAWPSSIDRLTQATRGIERISASSKLLEAMEGPSKLRELIDGPRFASLIDPVESTPQLDYMTEMHTRTRERIEEMERAADEVAGVIAAEKHARVEREERMVEAMEAMRAALEEASEREALALTRAEEAETREAAARKRAERREWILMGLTLLSVLSAFAAGLM